VRATYRQLADRYQRRGAQIERLIAERDALAQDAGACGRALGQVAGELSRVKDVVALHLVAAGHPSTVVHDVKSFAEALREALTASGVDLRLELARLEGADL
jgi:hypothetical protein